MPPSWISARRSLNGVRDVSQVAPTLLKPHRVLSETTFPPVSHVFVSEFTSRSHPQPSPRQITGTAQFSWGENTIASYCVLAPGALWNILVPWFHFTGARKKKKPPEIHNSATKATTDTNGTQTIRHIHVVRITQIGKK